jgi:ADP-ribose pyrophosphatase YjhB (NUDIX family)
MEDWIALINKIKAISQIGTAYSQDVFDRERYNQLSHISDLMYSKIAEVPIENVENFFIPDKGYATAKVDLRAGIFKDNQILLVREKRDNKWALPGGWADVGETPTEGIVREVSEEAGYNVRVKRLISVRDQSLHGYKPRYPVHVYKMLFLCEIYGSRTGKSIRNNEVYEARYFLLSSLPDLSKGTTLAEDILLLNEYYQDPGKLVHCD